MHQIANTNVLRKNVLMPVVSNNNQIRDIEKQEKQKTGTLLLEWRAAHCQDTVSKPSRFESLIAELKNNSVQQVQEPMVQPVLVEPPISTKANMADIKTLSMPLVADEKPAAPPVDVQPSKYWLNHTTPYYVSLSAAYVAHIEQCRKFPQAILVSLEDLPRIAQHILRVEGSYDRFFHIGNCAVRIVTEPELSPELAASLPTKITPGVMYAF